ncbi:MAG: phage tail protein, partial [Spirochaetales bacterium]|nr:phage tail protein [Spirochaetales bacterium]
MPAAIGWIASAAWAYIQANWVYLAFVAASYLYSTSQRPDSGSSSSPLGRKLQTTTARSGTTSQLILYGKTQVGGVLVYLASSGADKDYAHMVVAMAPHECEEIGDIYFDDKLATEFASTHYRIKKHLGSTDQVADADLISECDGVDSSFRLRGIAYVYVRFKFDRDVWPRGLPRNIKAIVKGKKLYDPREAGHVPGDSSTWSWSDNWALVMRDFITGSYGMGAVLAEVDDDNIIASANTSDEQVVKYDGTYQARYTVNGTIDTSDNLAANRDSLAQAGGGYAPWVEGNIKLMPGVYTPPVSRGLTDDDLRDTITISPRTPHQDIFNAVKGVYMGPSTDYQTTEFPPVANDFYKEQDGGEEIFTDIELPYCDDPDRAQRLAKMYLDRARQPMTINFPGKWTCFSYTVGDTVAFTLAAGREVPIFDGKEFRVIKWTLAANGDGVDLTLQEESSASYDWNQGDAVRYDTAPDTSLPSIFTPPPNVVNVAMTEEVYNYRLQSFTRLTVNFDQPPGYPYFDHVEVQHSVDGGVNYKQMADQASSFTIDPVSEGEVHYFRLKSVSSAGVSTPDSSVYL